MARPVSSVQAPPPWPLVLRYEYRFCLRADRRSSPYIFESASENRCTRDLDCHNFRRDRVALPFCHVHLKAQKPQKTQFTDPPKTIGEHIRKRRILLGWRATQLAVLLEVSKDTIYNWEHERSRPAIRFMPGIGAFLGYAPAGPTPSTLGERIKNYRIRHGLSQKSLARHLGIDPTTLRRLEHDRGRPTKRIMAKILGILKSHGDKANGSRLPIWTGTVWQTVPAFYLDLCRYGDNSSNSQKAGILPDFVNRHSRDEIVTLSATFSWLHGTDLFHISSH